MTSRAPSPLTRGVCGGADGNRTRAVCVCLTKTMPGKLASRALPRVSAVMPVLSETKYAARTERVVASVVVTVSTMSDSMWRKEGTFADSVGKEPRKLSVTQDCSSALGFDRGRG